MKHFVLPLALMTASCVTLACGQPTLSAPVLMRAQGEEKSISLTPAQLAFFPDALTALHNQAGLDFVVEGAPLQPRLSKEQLAAVKEALLPVPEAVAKVAALYDYDARKAAKGTTNLWILSKRYTDPRDLPQVTAGEIVAFLQDTQRILSVFNPNTPGFIDPQGHIYPNDPQIASFAPSLTPDQLELLRERKLPVASLSDDQKRMAQRFVSHLYIQNNTIDIENDLTAWKEAANASFMMGDWQGKRVFGFGGLDRYNREYFTSLQFPTVTRPTYDGSVETVAELPVLTSGGGEAALTTQTLETVVKALNARGDTVIYKVEPMLAAKPVVLIGGDRQPRVQILNALADMYGLRVRHDTEGEAWWLARVPGVVPSSGAGVADAVLAAVPLPLRRAAQIKPLVFAPETPPAFPELPNHGKDMSPEEIDRIMREHAKKTFEFQERGFNRTSSNQPGLLKRAASRYLQAVLEPRFKADPKARISVASLSEADRAAFALTRVSTALERIQGAFGKGTPAYVAKLDDFLLGGGPYRDSQKGEWRYELMLISPETHNAVTGVGNMRYTPPK